MEGEKKPPSDREKRKKRVEELGSALAQIRARVKATRGSGSRKDEEEQPPTPTDTATETQRAAMTKKILEEDRARFNKLQQNRVRMKEEYDQILIEREEQKKVEKQLQEAIAKVTAPTPELPPLIKQRIIDLETSVETLKERLSEKDKVLSSKTQALTVLHNQLMQRSQEQVEKAMAFTQEISSIKEDFNKREELLKKEINRLKEREEELELRLSDKEVHSFEFQNLHAELTEVRKELDEALRKTEETSKTLDSTSKINLKLKAQLKAMKIERDKLKQTVEGMEDAEALKNRIALLEEEKESFSASERRVQELTEEVSKLKENYKFLEDEKYQLSESLKSANLKIEEQHTLIEELQTSLQQTKELKISAEMRSIELEEKLEEFQNKSAREISTLQFEIQGLQSEMRERDSMIESLRNQLSLKEQEIFDIKGNNFPAEVETDARLRELESYNSELMEKVRELQLKSDGHEAAVVQLNEMLVEKTENINSLKMKCEELKGTISDLNNNKSELENEIKVLKSNEEAQKRLTPVPQESGENKEDLTQKFKKLAANYKIKVKLTQELEEKLKSSNKIIEENQLQISAFKSQINDLESDIRELKDNKTSLTSQLESAREQNQHLLKMVEDFKPRLEAMEVERSSAVSKADQMNKAFEELKEWKEGDSKLLKEHVTSVNSMAGHVSLLEQELQNLQTIVNEKNFVIGDLETERKKLVEDMKNSEMELERLRELYEEESQKNQNVLTNLQGFENEMLMSREEMNQIAEQLTEVTKKYESCLSSLQEREEYIEALEQDIVNMKSKMYNLESGITDKHRMLEERGNLLSAKLEEAEILSGTFDKYQAEMDKKLKMMEENEKLMKTNVEELQDELDEVHQLNRELQNKNRSSETQIENMNKEIETLRGVKNAYNTTLDQIEVLNEQLKMVMDDFENKNQEIIRLGEERAELFNKFTDLEEAYADLQSQLMESQENTVKLKSELTVKANILDNSLLEIKSLEKLVQELKSRNEGSTTTPQETDVVKVFSWDQHSQGPKESHHALFIPEDNSIKLELEEKNRLIEEAQKEIYSLQLQVATVLSQRDAQVSALREEISSLKSECEQLRIALQAEQNKQNTSLESNVAMFSWDQSQSSGVNHSNVQRELEQTRSQLDNAQKDVSDLRLSFDNMIKDMDREKERFRLETERLELEILKVSSEKSELERVLTETKDPRQEDDQCRKIEGLMNELKEKTELLSSAQQEIAHLQSSLNSMLNEKENLERSLREEIRQIREEKEELGRGFTKREKIGVEGETADEEVKLFSWGAGGEEGGDEEGWGWAGAEAHLDQHHSQAVQIQTLTARVQQLESETEMLSSKLNDSKIKCVKLVKKVKELEAVQIQSKTERSVGFSDLDYALQEEMRAQVDQLEAKNKELVVELNSLKQEKDKIMKKVDVLTSANDQLIEMKERQDIEVQMWQKRSAELKNEIQGLQWTIEEMKSENMGKGDTELSDQINALARENEELQRVICNLKDGRPIGSPEIAVEISALKEELKKLKDVRIKEKENFEIELRKANEELDAMEQQFDFLSKEKKTLYENLEAANSTITNLNEEIVRLTEANKNIEKNLSSLSQFPKNEDQLEILMNENASLRNQLAALSQEMVNVKVSTGDNAHPEPKISTVESCYLDVDALLEKIQTLSTENSELKEKLGTRSVQLPAEDLNQIEILQQHLDYVTAELSILKSDFQKVSSDNLNLQEELAKAKESTDSEVLRLMESLEKTETKCKSMDQSLTISMNELEELGSLLKNILTTLQVSVPMASRTEMLQTIATCIAEMRAKTSQLEKELHDLQDKQNPISIQQPTFGTSPPVFKGFSSFSNDPFDNIQANQDNSEILKLRAETADLHALIQSYELEMSRLNAERVSYEQEIARLKSEIAATNEHITKFNQQQSVQSEEVRQRLERADSEIIRWREEANSLRREIAELTEKHSKDMDELKRNEVGSKEKLSEIEENFQNTMLNKDQESRNLKQILSEKEQLLANAINERNALHTQFETVTQQLYSLEARVRDLTKENSELQAALSRSRGEENSIIQKQKQEIQDLVSKLERLSQPQNRERVESENETQLRNQLKEMSDSLSFLELSNSDMQAKLASQSEEILRLQRVTCELENQKAHLQSLLTQRQGAGDSVKVGGQSAPLEAVAQTLRAEDSPSEEERLASLVQEKELEIARLSQVLMDTQVRLVKVQDSKPMDRVIALEAKLDKALNTLHHRDVKIEELQDEILRLLGERDQLQLRLSETLRESELLKRGTPESSSASSPHITSKLGELQTGYKRDPVVQKEREARHTQEMDLYADQDKQAGGSTVDYGIFNWFFSTPGSGQAQPPS